MCNSCTKCRVAYLVMLLVSRRTSGFLGTGRLSDLGNLWFCISHFFRHWDSCIGSEASVNCRPQM